MGGGDSSSSSSSSSSGGGGCTNFLWSYGDDDGVSNGDDCVVEMVMVMVIWCC